MPTSIPYDPSLVLGNIVNMEKLENLEQIAAAEAPVNAAGSELKSLIAMKQKIDMTKQEIVNMGGDVTKLEQESQKVMQSIQDSAINYAEATIKSEQQIQPLKAKMLSVNESVESPLDYNRTQIKKMPLSADSMIMNCQYFSFDKNTQDSGTHASTIAAFGAGSVSEGHSFAASGATSATVQKQVHQQYQAHDIAGTLVISINCTHKDALLLAPYYMDIDKAIRVWNEQFPKDELNTLSVYDIEQALTTDDKAGNSVLNLLSGVTMGSSFVGMVHVLNSKSTSSIQSMSSVADSIQAQFTAGNWYAHGSGSWGMDSSFSNSAKGLLSQQKVSSHCTLSVMGSIPTMKANSVKMAVEQFSNFSGADAMKELAAMQNSTSSSQSTLQSSAMAARTSAQMANLQVAKISPTLSALSETDAQQNQILNTNSMIDAMEDYINKCLAGNIGVPINYFLKPIKKKELAEAWIAKYYPSKNDVQFNSGDDSDTNKPGSTATTAAK